MQVGSLQWKDAAGWTGQGLGLPDSDLVLYFGSREVLADGTRVSELRKRFPSAHVMGCSTGGQIVGSDINDDGVAAVGVHFANTKLKMLFEPLSDPEGSEACGQAIGRALKADDLAGIFVLSDGLQVNGSKLVTGIGATAGANVPISGGLAGDGARFERTLVGADCAPQTGIVAAVGFYGSHVKIAHGSAGGWDVFGPKRRISRANNNVLFELDDEPALDLYERYLGAEESAALPGSAFLYPLQIFDPNKPDQKVVRTVLAVDRASRSMTFAGDMPEGWTAQLMRGNFDHLIGGSAEAARKAQALSADSGDGLALLVSCIGRRVLMGQRTVDEVVAADHELTAGMERIGFYAYGEISPHAGSGVCELHNQTMTVTTISESAQM